MLCNANPRNKENTKPKNNGHKEYSNEAQGPCNPRRIKDAKSHKLLDEEY